MPAGQHRIGIDIHHFDGGKLDRASPGVPAPTGIPRTGRNPGATAAAAWPPYSGRSDSAMALTVAGGTSPIAVMRCPSARTRVGGRSAHLHQAIRTRRLCVAILLVTGVVVSTNTDTQARPSEMMKRVRGPPVLPIGRVGDRHAESCGQQFRARHERDLHGAAPAKVHRVATSGIPSHRHPASASRRRWSPAASGQ